MASLKRDTPAGRAALARRRQRAAALVDQNARFGVEEGILGTSHDASEQEQEKLSSTSVQQSKAQQQPAPSKSHPRHRSQADPEGQQRSRLKDPPQRAPLNTQAASSPTSYSTSRLPSSDELLERSSLVAQAAASVLASARKTKSLQHDDTGHFPAGTRVPEREHTVVLERANASHQDPAHSPELSGATRQTFPTLTGTKVATNPSHSATGWSADSWQAPGSLAPESVDMYDVPGAKLRFGNVHRSGPNADEDNAGAAENGCNTEETERVIPLNNDCEVLDARCLRSGDRVLLRSMATSAHVTAIASLDKSCNSVVSLDGSGVGASYELFRVVKSDGRLDSTRNSHESKRTPFSWGDKIALLPVEGKHKIALKALGVIARSGNDSSAASSVRIGWLQPVGGHVDTWTLLKGLHRRADRVDPSTSPTTDQAQRPIQGDCTRHVQSGEPVLLRHDQTGGLLALKIADGAPHLTCSSYDPTRGEAAQADSATSHNTFSFVLALVPPCPRWIVGVGQSCMQTFNPSWQRMYLHQTYLTAGSRKVETKSIPNKLFHSSIQPYHEPPTEKMDLAHQESLIVDEVLGASLGLEGRYVCVHVTSQDAPEQSTTYGTQSLKFVFRDSSIGLFDASLRHLAERLLPLGASYSNVSSFVALHLPGYEYGSIMQAFCEALDSILKEYGKLVAELEDHFRKPRVVRNALSLRRLFAHLMPSVHIMSILEKATLAVQDKTGGALLNSLNSLKSWSCEGDDVANTVLGTLIEKSSAPYMRMLTTWLQHGILQDPYQEFMIKIQYVPLEKKSLPQKDVLTRETLLLKGEHVLKELMMSGALLQQVISTGKYWRAVKTCEVALGKPSGSCQSIEMGRQHAPSVLEYSLSFGSLASFVRVMHDGASRALVHILTEDFNLMYALRLMKQYFLLGHSDFLVHFLDSAESELLKEVGDISSGRIQHWLRMSVQMTEPRRSTGTASVGLSPLALRCRLEPKSLFDHIDSINFQDQFRLQGSTALPLQNDSASEITAPDTMVAPKKGLIGVETLVLDFPFVPFPISMVLTEAALSKYQLLFRLLFFAKYAEQRLLRVWKDHQAMKELSSCRGLFGPTFLLRQRMLHFLQNLIYFFMFEVIEPNWLEMEEAIGCRGRGGWRTVDNIVEVHEAFLQRTLEACLLTNGELVRTLTKLMTTSLMFADQMKLFTEATRIHDESSHIAAERRKEIHRSLNDRGGGGAKVTIDKNAVRDSLNTFRVDRQIRLKKQKRRVGRELSSDSYRRMVSRFDEVFSAYLSEFMLQLSGDVGTAHQEHKANLSTRLDYNFYLSSTLK